MRLWGHAAPRSVLLVRQVTQSVRTYGRSGLGSLELHPDLGRGEGSKTGAVAGLAARLEVNNV